MALPPDLLGDLRDLEGTVAAVRDAVDAALAAGRGGGPTLTAGGAVAGVEGATLAWLDRTAALERRLRAHAEAQPGDAEDVADRLGGLAVLHVAAAGDLGAVEALDRGDDGGDVRSLAAAAGWPEYASAIQATAFDAGLVRALGDPDPSGPDDGPDATVRAEPERDEGPSEDVAEVVRELVERAGVGASAVLFGLAGGVGQALFATLSTPLTTALDLGPDAVRSAASGIAGRIAGLVGRLIARVEDVLGAVLGNYREAVGAVIEEADPASFVGETLAGKVVGKVLRADGIRAEAVARLASDPGETASRLRRMRRLARSNRRWVGPVRFAARGLPHLWGVPLGPVPAAPVAAVALLAWTVVVTGDQLDTAGPVPDLWVGVLRIAEGES